jgi:hypothetical protein
LAKWGAIFWDFGKIEKYLNILFIYFMGKCIICTLIGNLILGKSIKEERS